MLVYAAGAMATIHISDMHHLEHSSTPARGSYFPLRYSVGMSPTACV